MSDYISKEDALNILYNTFEEYNMTTDKQDKHGGFGAEVFKRVRDIPTLDEKEIIRKPMERILKKLGKKEELEVVASVKGSLEDARLDGYVKGIKKAIEVVKKEGGVE